jgi:hypothetical protein
MKLSTSTYEAIIVRRVLIGVASVCFLTVLAVWIAKLYEARASDSNELARGSSTAVPLGTGTSSPGPGSDLSRQDDDPAQVAGSAKATRSLVVGNSPPSSTYKSGLREAAFVSEAVDPDWRHRMFEELSARLAVIEQGIESAQIDCRSATCRVELVSRVAETREERMTRLKLWFQELKELGFNRADTEFSANGTGSLSYVAIKPVNATAELPPEFPPEVAESFRQALRDNKHQPITEPGGVSAPITWVGGTPGRGALEAN